MGHNILISIFSGIGTGIISAVIPLIPVSYTHLH